MTLEDAIRLRRSIRRYRDDRPARELVEKLLEMAVHAPSASNKQPWRFFVVDHPATIARMAAKGTMACSDWLVTDLGTKIAHSANRAAVATQMLAWELGNRNGIRP